MSQRPSVPGARDGVAGPDLVTSPFVARYRTVTIGMVALVGL